MSQPEPKFALFVRCVPGRAVRRFGSGPDVMIGAERRGTEIAWDADRVVALTEAEVLRFGREYQKAIRLGDLLEANADEWKVWIALQASREATEQQERERAAAELEQKRKDEAAKQAPADSSDDAGGTEDEDEQ